VLRRSNYYKMVLRIFHFERIYLFVVFLGLYTGYDPLSWSYGLFTTSTVFVFCLCWQKLKVEKVEDDENVAMEMEMERLGDSSAPPDGEMVVDSC
jgi:hypothetical protein